LFMDNFENYKYIVKAIERGEVKYLSADTYKRFTPLIDKAKLFNNEELAEKYKHKIELHSIKCEVLKIELKVVT